MTRCIAARLIRLACAIALAGVVLFTSAPAHAQMGMGMGGGMNTMVSRRSIDAYTKILGLDKDQKEVLTNLYEGYKKDHEAAMEKMQADMRSLQEKFADTQDIGAMQKDALRFSKKFAEKSRELEKIFLADFKLSLNDEQLAKWPQVERYARRDKHMKFAMVSGSAVDLTKVIERVKAEPAESTEFASVLERYEQDMDKHLVAMDKLQEEVEVKMYDTEANMMDMTRWSNLFKEFYPLSRDMRETNKEYARKLSMLMTEESRRKFDEEFRARAFPRVYRVPPVLKMIENTEKLTDLDPAKKADVAAIKAAFLRDLGPLNEKWARAAEERDDEGGGSLAIMMASMQGGAGELNKGVNKAREARKELETTTRKRLEELLTEEQRVKVAPPPSRDSGNPWIDMMPEDE